MAISSESLRCYGLSMSHSHVVLLTRTRACTSDSPPKPPTVPRWKLIRPRKKTVISSEPQKLPLPKPEHFIEVTSPFLFRSVVSIRGCVPELEAKPSTLRKSFHGSILLPISETEETGSLETDVAEPNSDEQKVTAEDKIKDDDHITNDRPATAIKDPAAKEFISLPKTWVDIDGFGKCFQTLLVFHKPQMYTNHIHKSHFKSTVSPKDMGGISGLGSSNHCLSDQSVDVASAECSEVRGTYYLYVDSSQPSEILISFSALLLWGDFVEEKKQLSGVHRSAVLLIQPQSWTSASSQLPVLTIKTTYSKAAMLSLPAGRHVFCLHTQGTLGYHIHSCSNTQFVFGDEETIMPHLAKESARFTEQALSILRASSSIVASFTDEQKSPSSRRALEETHFPQSISSSTGKWEHQKSFNSAVYHMVCEALGRKSTSEERFALRALTADPSLLAPDLEVSPSNYVQTFEEVEDMKSTDKEIQAAIISQAGFKGHLVRGVLKASKPGMKENLSASQILSDIWSKIESDADKHAAFLLRYIIKNYRKNGELYPCSQDESTKITFADYSVSFQETAHSWVSVFREVFFVPEEMSSVPIVYSPVPNCCSHVVNNDTGEEVGMLKVLPHVYKPNKLGYTFVAEVIKPDIPVSDAKWRMRLIGSQESFPKSSREIPVSAFSVKEFQDYYIPNKNLICRCCVQVTTDASSTIQFETSDPHVLIRSSVSDEEKEVAGKNGKGFVVLPVFFFSASKGQRSEPSGADENKQMMPPHQDTPQKRDGADSAALRSDISSDCSQDHKYVVQAEVLCSSWNLDESQSAFLHMLQEMKKNEMRVFKHEPLKSSSTTSTSSQDVNKADTTKTSRKGEGDKHKGKTSASSRPGQKHETSSDSTKPNWISRVVTDQTNANCIVVKRDTERVDKIRSIKKAWEKTESGRFEKAFRSRLQFLNKVQQKENNDVTSDESKDIAPTSSDPDTNVSPSSGKMTAPSWSHLHIDYSHLIRHQKDFPQLMDSQQEEAREKQRFEKIQKYRMAREKVSERYKQQMSEKNELMKHHLEVYKNMSEASEKLSDDYKGFCRHSMESNKKEREEKPASEEAESVVPEKTASTSAAAKPLNKHAKKGEKK